VVFNVLFANVFGFLPEILSFNISSQLDLLIGTTVIALFSWLLSIVLLGINRELIRLLEGYGGIYSPFTWFKNIELNKYDSMKDEITELDEKYIEHSQKGEKIPTELIEKRNRAIREFKLRFPTERRHVLPTSFGNTIRAFEVYSREMYGIDAIPGWNRLIAVMPKEYKTHIDDTKVLVSFWMNTFYLNLILLFEYFIILLITGEAKLWLFPLFLLILIYISYERARKASVQWGDTVKSAFDVFLLDLWKEIGFDIPETKEGKKKIWKRFNQAVIYGRPDIMPDRKNLGKDKKSK
jgi:hypothetical protein